VRDANSVLLSGSVLFAVTWIATWFGVSVVNVDIVVGASAASFLATVCFWLSWLAGRVATGPILKDIAIGLVWMGLILVPAIIAERWVRLHLDGLSDLSNLLIRGSSYTIVALSLLIATGAHAWFLLRKPSDAA
jgi:hypothetical protein